MGDIKLEAPPRDNPVKDEALLRLLLDANADRKILAPGQKDDRKDLFLRFDDPFSKRDRSEELIDQVDQINRLVTQRRMAEGQLNPEQKDELRRARRDYVTSKTGDEQAKYAKQIENLVPGSAALNKRIDLGLRVMDSIHTSAEKPQFDPQACMRHRPLPKVYYDPYVDTRKRTRAGSEGFYEPRKEDEFEARWAKIALESPVVKVNEALKQLPPLKVTSDDPVKLIKMGLTVAGVEVDFQSGKLIEQVAGGIKGISKEGSNRFAIDRAAKIEIPFPQKRYLGAGIELRGLELDCLRFTIGEGKYPEIKDIKGLKVKLDVPAVLNQVGQIDNEAAIQRIFLTRNEGTGDFQVNAEVVNPLPWLVRKAAHQFYKDVPENSTIIVPIATLGSDGKPK